MLKLSAPISTAVVNPTLADARAELLRLERMAAHQRSVIAALEALAHIKPFPPLGMGPLTPELCIDEGCPQARNPHVCISPYALPASQPPELFLAV